ncbi:histone acetylation protein 2 [Hypoxylon sp. NC1633]|nr:histone acetylation protein 2 [Hypoxylon sp. NC1633]
MPPSSKSHARSHALLLLQKLLNLRDTASPLTLVLDTLEQSAKPLIREFLSRAKASKSKVLYISFATLRKPANVDVFVRARGKSAEALRSEIASHYPPGTAGHAHKVLVVIDELNPLAATTTPLALFLSGLITPAVSLVGVYHADVPLSIPHPSCSSSSSSASYRAPCNEYEPHPLTTLSHLATAVLRVGSLYQAIERQRARDRSQPAPEWGLAEGREGVLVGLGGEKKAAAGSGLVVEMELRRRSGRAVAETFVLVPPSSSPPHSSSSQIHTGSGKAEMSPSTTKLYLLSDHPAFRSPDEVDGEIGGGDEGEEDMGTTFNLGLTEKQRRDREGIVLPYFDAQTDIGAGEGGRILYEMGREDDFDDEEDEI